MQEKLCKTQENVERMSKLQQLIVVESVERMRKLQQLIVGNMQRNIEITINRKQNQ